MKNSMILTKNVLIEISLAIVSILGVAWLVYEVMGVRQEVAKGFFWMSGFI